MASNLNDNDEERDRRVELVGEYYLQTPNASVRSTANYFTEHYFTISGATVSN